MEEIKVMVVEVFDNRDRKSCVLTDDYNVKDGIRMPVANLSKEGNKRTCLFQDDVYMDIYYIEDRNIVGCYIMNTERVRQLEFNMNDNIRRKDIRDEIYKGGFKHDSLVKYLLSIIYDNEISGFILFYILKNVYKKGLGDIYALYDIIKECVVIE